MPTGSTTHAHEYRLLFAAPDLEEAALDGWWTYAAEAEDALVQADAQHSFSLVSLILVTGPADKALQKKIKKLSAERHYEGEQGGWSTIRLAVVDLVGRKVYANVAGDPLKGILKPFL